MSTSWTLTDMELVALLTESNDGDLPMPLMFTSRITDADEFERELLMSVQRLRAAPVFDLDRMLGTLAHPDITVEICGWDVRGPDGPDGIVRIHAARRAAHGIVINQLTGETRWHSGGFVITECRAVDIGSIAVGHLPAAVAGTWGEVPLIGGGDGLDHSYGRSAVQVKAFAAEDVPARAVRFQAAPVGYCGQIQIAQVRSAFGPRGCARYEFDWQDLVGDGRYLISDTSPPVAIPVDAGRLAARINTRIAAIVQIMKDESPRRSFGSD